MKYTDYRNTRDAVWQLLIDMHTQRLPIKISALCRAFGIEVRTMEQLAPSQHALNASGHNVVDGVARYIHGQPIILYNSLASHQRARFTIAHELGHIILGHLVSTPGHTIVTPILFRKTEEELSPEERAANVFASRLLAPACVLWGLGVTNAKQIARLCDISQEAAQYRMQRMKILYKRNDEYLRTRGHPCFLQSRLEQQVYKQFEPFILDNPL